MLGKHDSSRSGKRFWETLGLSKVPDMSSDDRPIPQRMPIVGVAEAGEYTWCACGRSANQPYCDGSHKNSGYLPLRVVVKSDRKVAWCACKRTGTPPFCDGSHAKLPPDAPSGPPRLKSIRLDD
jgi:CDGSH-type Zn-finger protein